MANNNRYSGIVFIDKPKGLSSFKVDLICKHIFKAKKIGHLGTLDPFACGILPIAINYATKLIPYFKWTNEKTYIFEAKFGEQTDTGDLTGKVIKSSKNIPDQNEIETILPKFIGQIYQTPHRYSAVKIHGKNAYQLARENKTFELKPKQIHIKSLQLIQQIKKEVFKFQATVSSGTYIRTLVEDIAIRLKTQAHTISIRRKSVGPYDTGITLDLLEKNSENIGKVVYPVEDLLDDIPVVLISDVDACNLRFGRSIKLNFNTTKDSIFIFAKSPKGYASILQCLGSYWQPKKLIRDFQGE